MRESAAQLRQQVGEDEPGDFADKSPAISGAEEQEFLAGQLEARRTDLLHRLGAD